MKQVTRVSIAILVLMLVGTPAGASSCALKGRFVASAAVSVQGAPAGQTRLPFTQALITFDFIPPDPCEVGVPGTVHIVSKMMGQASPGATSRPAPQFLEITAPYLVDAEGRLTIEAGSVVLEGLVGLVEAAVGDVEPPVPAARPASANLNLSKSNVNVFVFTAGEQGSDPNVGFSGFATTVKSSKSNSQD
jgi:hypothetical protein